MIDERDIERVRQAVDIVAVISDYVTLKRRGQGDWWGLCPFHGEKTPSFHVRADRGMFHCFGCGRGGNVFTFLMEIEGISFTEAVKSLADKVGISLQWQALDPAAERSRTERDRLLAANAFAMRYFHDRLTRPDPSPAARKARQYLADRGITSELVSRFHLGWAEPEADALVKAASAAGIGGHLLTQAGLAFRRRDGEGFLDRFRARIILPILNLSNKPVAFGARRVEGVTPETEEAKYINTPETPVYVKGEHLYGLTVAREAIRRQGFAYLVEGYTDLIALFQAGLENSVASLGTAFTPAQARLIRRFAPSVCVVYDADPAGQAAAMRAADIITQAGMEARLVRLPEGDDPDSILRRSGPERLREVLTRPMSFVQFRLEPLQTDPNLSPAAKISAARELLDLVAGLADPLQIDLLVKEIATRLDLAESALYAAMRRARRTPSPALEPSRRPELAAGPEYVAERDLMKALLAFPELFPRCVGEVTAEMFRHPDLRRMFAWLEGVYVQGQTPDITALPDRFPSQEARAFIASAALWAAETDPVTAEAVVKGAALSLAAQQLEKRKDELRRRIRQAASEGRDYRQLHRDLVEVERSIRSMKAKAGASGG